MIKRVYSVFDEKSGVFSNPVYLIQDGEALRSFSDVVSDKDSAIGKHPKDYKLYRLGEFDDISGEILSLEQPLFLANATDFVGKLVADKK